MALNNPLAGGPDYVQVLANALEKRPGSYLTPPPTGGDPTSVRFTDERVALLNAVAARCGWNRNQIVNAFVDRGLFELFSYLNDKLVAQIMDSAVAERPIPTLDRTAVVLKELAAYNRFRLFPCPRRYRDGQVPRDVEAEWVLESIDRERGTVQLCEAIQAGQPLPPLHASHIDRIQPDTAQDAANGLKNAMLVLNVQIALEPKAFRLVPVIDSVPFAKREKR